MAIGITAGEIMHKGVLTIRGTVSVKEVAEALKKAKVGGLIVTENGKSVGIITEGDIVQKVVAEGKDPEKTKASDVMSTPLRTVKKSMDIEDLARIMRDAGVDRLPVTGEHGKIIGMITERDLVKTEPALIKITREEAEIGSGVLEPSQEYLSGECESCGNYSTQLVLTSQGLLCPECRRE